MLRVMSGSLNVMHNFVVFEITEAATLRKWGKRLMGELHDEAIAEIKKEGLLLEAMHYFHVDERHFIAGISVNNPRATTAEPDMRKAINRTHREKLALVKKCKIPTEVVYELGDL